MLIIDIAVGRGLETGNKKARYRMHLDTPITGQVTDVYPDGTKNRVLCIAFDDAGQAPNHCPVGTISAKKVGKLGLDPNRLHVGSKVLVTDVSDTHPPGVHQITGIAEPEA